MRRSTRGIRSAGIGFAWAIVLLGCAAPAETPAPMQLAPVAQTAQFATVGEPLEFRAPFDHGPHFEYQTEWWYYTGQLESEAGERFGYQLTFFRRGLAPGTSQRESQLATQQIYFAHLALTDLAEGEHRAYERFSREADGLAGASGDPLRVYLEDWTLAALDSAGSEVRLQAAEADIGLDLRLRADQALVAHGPGGLSPKGANSSNASYYFSFPWMGTEGVLTVRGEQFRVRGSSWFDHEWGSSGLPPGAAGWDWFGLQLDDGRALMLYQVRSESSGMVRRGTLVEPDGRTVWLTPADFQIETLESWTSPSSGAEYPSEWRVSLPEQGLELELRPILADQENLLSIVYWEGAVEVLGSVSGRGYVELTGYQSTLQPWF